MLVPDIANPYFTLMARAIEDAARAAGYSVMLCNTDEDPAREQDYLRVAASDPVAGIVMVPTAAARLDVATERGIPVVCADRHAPHFDTDAVVADNAKAAAAATRRLYEAGYQHLACITGPTDVETSNERLAGWALAVREYTGAEPDPAWVRRARYVEDADGERAARQLLGLDSPPDAIFAANNRLATGVLRALYAADRLPPAVGLVSFGGPPAMLFTPPGLISTYLPAREIGVAAAAMLLERIGGLDVPPRSVTLPVGLGD